MARNLFKKRLLNQAAKNHLSVHRGATAKEIAYDGKIDNGRLLRSHKMGSTNPQQAYAWLRVDPDFILKSDGKFYLKG